MGIRIIMIVIFIMYVSVSCNKRGDRNNPRPIEAKQKKNKSQILEVSFDIKSKDDNQYILYYKDGTTEWFDENHTIWVGASGGEKYKTVTFRFDKDVKPNELRLDIGLNEFKNNSPIEIGGGAFKYSGNSKEFNSSQFMQYFSPNQCITYDSITKQYFFNTDENGKFDPFFVSTSKANTALRQLIKEAD